MSRALAGRWRCGAVHYAIADEFLRAVNCHGSNRPRATGSAFKPFVGVEIDGERRLAVGSGRLTLHAIRYEAVMLALEIRPIAGTASREGAAS